MLTAAVAAAVLSAAPPADDALRRGNEAFARKDYAEAVRAYAAAEERIADPGQVAFNKATALYHLGQYREAEALLRSAVARHESAQPVDVYNLRRSLGQLGDLLLRTGRMTEALPLAQRILELSTGEEERLMARHNLAQIEPADLPEWKVIEEEELPRRDLTQVPFFTIDGAKTKDMDDALAITKLENGWELLVAIADPTAYVAEGSELDKEAAQRAFTVYMPGRNVPMIPRTLSDELCSLKEGEERNTLCARLLIAEDGLLLEETEFFAARIVSHARLSYDDVSDWAEHGKELAIDAGVLAQLPLMKAMTEARIKWRTEHALVFPDRPDYDFELGQDGEVLAIHVEPRRIANRMVEESMIAANICAGRVLGKQVGYGIFNVHTGFDEESLDGAIELLKTAEAPFEKEDIASLSGFCALRRWIDGLDTRWLDGKIRRFQSYALMSAEPGAHYGLGLDAYATWTSPIRKYGDMVNHRLLKAVIAGKTPGERPSLELTEHLTACRRLHRMVERDIGDWLYVRYLKADAGTDKVFNAEIIDVMRAGLKLRLQENGAVVFMPARHILDNKDRLECNWDNGRVYLDKTEVVYELGQIIEVKLTEAVEETRSLIAKPAVDLVPGPAPVVSASEAEAAPTAEAPKAE